MDFASQKSETFRRPCHLDIIDKFALKFYDYHSIKSIKRKFWKTTNFSIEQVSFCMLK